MDPRDGPQVCGAGGSVCWLSGTPPNLCLGGAAAVGTPLSFCPSTHPLLHPSIRPPTRSPFPPASQPRVELQPSAPGCRLCTPRDLMPPPQPVPRARGCSQTCTFIYKKPSARAGPCKPCTEPKATSTCCHQRGWGAAFRPHPYPGPSTEGSAAATEGTDTPAACTALAPRHKKKLGAEPGANQHGARLEAAKLGAAVLPGGGLRGGEGAWAGRGVGAAPAAPAHGGPGTAPLAAGSSCVLVVSAEAILPGARRGGSAAPAGLH